MASLLRLLEMPELTDKRSWSEMSARSSQEFEECAVCFYLSRHVYQRLLRESTRAFPSASVWDADWSFRHSSPVCLLACRFLLYLCFVFVPLPSLISFKMFLSLGLWLLSESRSLYGPWVIILCPHI